VLVLSADDAPETAQLARERGARSFISKGDTADNILAAILSVLRGEADDAEMSAQQMQEKPEQTLQSLC
jgi:DNA-binding NarL/FixJ family response regulator